MEKFSHATAGFNHQWTMVASSIPLFQRWAQELFATEQYGRTQPPAGSESLCFHFEAS
jgi:hypothetical protein